MSAKEHRYPLKEIMAVAAVIAVLLVADIIFGAFPIDIFRFPLNVIAIVLWLLILGDSYRRRGSSRVAQYLLSLRATWLSLILMVVVGITLGVQRAPATTSWFVVGAILFMLSHLTMVILRGWCNSHGLRVRFILTHCGLWLALMAGFWGAADREELRMAVERDKPSDMAINNEEQPVVLNYTIQLLDFDVEYYDNGTPSSYEATVAVDGRNVKLMVNKPYNHTWSETIYLVNYGVGSDNEPYCIVEVVREPWRWLSATGIIMLIAGAVMLFLRGPQHKIEGQKE